jgi:6-pyruvoyl-tetrahydropterin synthase related domain
MTSPSNASPRSPSSAFREWLLAAGVSLSVSLAIVLPFFWLGSASGHDFEFHIASWLDVAGQWREGIWLPRWMEWANHGFGEPRFLFYPPLSWLIAPALSFAVRWVYVPVAFIVIAQTLAGLSAFALARSLKIGRAALFAALCYAANPNALLIVYLRSDYAELLASAFFPLLFLAALKLAGVLECSDRGRRRTLAVFAFLFAVIWLSNAPAGVMITYSAAGLFVYAALAAKSRAPLLYGGPGIGLGFGLAAFYLVPAAYEQRWVNIAQALSTGLVPAENFLYTATNDPEHTLFNWIASTTAILLIVVTGTAAVGAHRRRSTEVAGSMDGALGWWRALLVLAVISILLMLRGTADLWQWLPKLRFVQFPWRWMSVLAVAFSCLVAAASADRRFRWLWVSFVTISLVATGWFFVRETWWDTDDVPTLQAAITHGVGFDGTDEYDPVGDDHYNLPDKAPPVQVIPGDDSSDAARGVSVNLKMWTASRKEIEVSSPEPVRIALRLLNYPAWRVTVNGKRIEPGREDEINRMVLDLPAGNSEVGFRFETTKDRMVGWIISLVSVLAAAYLAFWPATFTSKPRA